MKYHVWYNDDVNESVEVYSADTLEECKQWIDETTKHAEKFQDGDSEYLLSTSRTYEYEVFHGNKYIPVEDACPDVADPVYLSDYFYTD